MSGENAAALAAALRDVTVVDMTQALAGPYLAMLLGDLGAEVVKVERPDGGDQSRGWGPPFASTESSYYLAVNRNKRSVTCNFRTTGGVGIVRRLAERADVLLTNERREGYRRAMGIDYDGLRARNPRVVYCSITGYGMTGPYAGLPGYDIIAQGMAGLMPLTGPLDAPPYRYPASIADLATALYGLGSILAALFARERSGRGQYIDLSLVESQAWWGVIQAGAYLVSGQPPKKLGNDHQSIVPYGTFRAQDGYLIIACATEALWERLCEVMEMPEVHCDPRFHVNRQRVVHREEMRRVMEERLAARPAAEWLERLQRAGVPCGPIYDIAQLLADEQTVARGFVVEQDHPTVGTLHTLASPLHLSDTPATYRRHPPLLGEHTDEVLGELGYSAEEITTLHAEGAV